MKGNIGTICCEMSSTEKMESTWNVLKGAHCKVSFLGKRVVYVHNPEGEISLTQLATRLLNEANLRCVAQNLSLKERVVGIEIVKKIQDLYKEGDLRTPLCTKIFQCFFGKQDTMRVYFESAEDYLRAYTYENFRREFECSCFGGLLSEMVDYPTFFQGVDVLNVFR